MHSDGTRHGTTRNQTGRTLRGRLVAVLLSIALLPIGMVGQLIAAPAASAAPASIAVPSPRAQIQRFQNTASQNRVVSPGPPSADWSSWVVAGAQATTSHGLSTGSGVSTIGVTPNAPGTVNEGAPFLLAQFSHNNRPVMGAAQYDRTGIRIQFGTNGPTFSMGAELNETTNTGPGCCNDILTLDSTVFNGEVQIDGYTYRLAARGFTRANQDGGCPTTPSGAISTTFVTVENANTFGCMYASLERVRKLTITKRVELPNGQVITTAPDPMPAFTYTSTSSLGTSWNRNFNLDPTTGAQYPASLTQDLLSTERVSMGEAIVGEDPLDEWNLQGVVCRDVSAPGVKLGNEEGTIIPTIAAGGSGITTTASGQLTVNNVVGMTTTPDAIECTYTNIYTPKAKLTLVKKVEGGPAALNQFTLSATGNAPGSSSPSGVSGSPAVTNVTVTAGNYTLAEYGPAYYEQVGNWDCGAARLTGSVVTLEDGDNVTCTVTNVPVYGDVDVAKVITDPAGGFTGDATTAFTGDLICTPPDGGADDEFVYSTTTGTPWGSTDLLAGTVCQVANEDRPAQSLLDNTSYYWGAATWTPEVTIGDDTTSTVTITNPVQQRMGQLQIAKQVTGTPQGQYTGGANRTFTIGYVCTLDGDTVANSSVSLAAGVTSAVIPVPAGATCTVSEATPTVQAGDFPAPSYSWQAPTIPAPVTISENVTSTATVTNNYVRQFGSIQLQKLVTGSGAPFVDGGTTFTVQYTCGADFTGTVSLAPGAAPVVVNNLPLNELCTFTELNPPTGTSAGLPAVGTYVWGSPTYSSGGQLVVGATPPTGIVTNPTIVATAEIQINKLVTGATDGFNGGNFFVDISCVHPQTGAVIYTADNAALSTGSAFVSNQSLPVGTTCTVTEETPSSNMLDDDSYRWGATPGPQTVVAAPRHGVGQTTISNIIERVFGQLTLNKVVVNLDGVAQDGGFSGTWSCPSNAGVQHGTDGLPATFPASGTWTTTGEGAATFYDTAGNSLGADVDVILNGSCSVTENTGIGQRPALTQPVPPIFAWAPPRYSPAQNVTVSSATPNQNVTVTNEVIQFGNRFGLQKQLGDNPQGAASDASFHFEGYCVTPAGLRVENEWDLGAGEFGPTTQGIPTGSTCTITESGVGDEDLIDGGAGRYSWSGVTWSSAPIDLSAHPGWAVSDDGYTVTFTISETLDPEKVGVLTATNHIVENTAPLVVSKTVSGEAVGYDGSPVFHIDVDCGADGTFQADIADGGSFTFNVPANASCTVTERALGREGLVDGSYEWTETTYAVGDGAADSAPPTVGVGTGGADVAIDNEIGRVFAPLQLRKELDDPTGVVADGREFSGTWTCTYTSPDGLVVEDYNGTWSGVSDEQTITLPDSVPVGSVCTVNDEVLSVPPSEDPSFIWNEFTSPQVTVDASGGTLVVQNSVERQFGTLMARKVLTGATEGYIGTGADFLFGYTCTLDPEDPDSPTLSGSLGLIQGQDYAVVTDQIPFGWNCTVNETAPAAALLNPDGSYAWGETKIDPPSGVVSETENLFQVTVTNDIERVYGSFAINKLLQGVPTTAVSGPFNGNWECAYGDELYDGTWSAPAIGGAATITGDGEGGLPGRVPVSAQCSVTAETQPVFSDPSWQWNAPDLGATVSVQPGDQPQTITVTNSASRVLTTLNLTKVSAATNAILDPGATVAGVYSCAYEGNPNTTADNESVNGRWTRSAAGESAVLAGPTGAPIQVPVGSVCTIREDTPDNSVFIDGSYRWTSRTYTPANALGDAAVVNMVADPAANQATVDNQLERVYGAFLIDKVVAALAPATDESITRMDNVLYAGEYRCVYTGNPDDPADDVPVTGPWSTGNNPTQPEIIGGVLVGSTCELLTEIDPASPFRSDPSYVWVSRDLGDAVVVPAAGIPQITVTNTYTRLMGDFSMLKDIIGATNDEVGNPDFTIDWTCQTGDGTPDLSGPNQPIVLTPDVLFESPQPFPDGTYCEMEEAVPDDVPGYTWLPPYWTAINFGESGNFQSEGYTVRGTIPIGDQEVAITLFNPVVKDGYTVTKTSDPLPGVPVVPNQQITYTLTVTPEDGYARDVVVTDALSGVLDNATLDQASIVASHGTFEIVGDQLIWTLPELRGDGPDLSGLPDDVATAPWDTTGPATISYTVTVNEDAWGQLLNNSVTTQSNPDTPCIDDPTTAGNDCNPTTEHPVPGYQLSKSSDPGTGSTVQPGSTVNYTLTVTNTSQASVTNAVIVDDLTDVVDNTSAPVVTNPPGTAVYDPATFMLTWTPGTIPVDNPATPEAENVRVLEYSVVVNSDAWGATLTNVATPSPDAPGCVDDPDTQANECGGTTTHLVPNWSVTKTADPASGTAVAPGDDVTYTLTFTNTGQVAISGQIVTDDLSDVLDDAELMADLPAGLTITDQTLRWAVPEVAVGGSATVSYSVTVQDDAWGETLRNHVTPTSPGCVDDPATPDDECGTSTENPVPDWRVAKTSDPASGTAVTPGQTVTYTLTFTNTGPVAITGQVVTDDLSDVLDDATLGALPPELTLAGQTLSWAVPEVPAEGTATVSYTVVLDDDAWNGTLRNVVAQTSPGCVDDPATPDDECSTGTENPVPGYSVTKTSDPVDGAAVVPGQTVTYTLTVRNTSKAVVTSAMVNDNLADVLDDADWVGFVGEPAGAELTGTTLSWLPGELAVGASVELSYQVVVRGGVGAKLNNVAVPGDGGDCVVDCETTHPVPGYTLDKTSNPADGSKVAVGSTIVYTLTVHNVGTTELSGRVVTDDLSDVLDDARLSGDLPAGVTVSGNTLTWTVPNVPVGGTVSVSYSVVVKSDAYSETLRNVASVGNDPLGGCASDCSTEHQTYGEKPKELPRTGVDQSGILVLGFGALLIGGLALGRRRNR